jgi:hypothetical protein
MARYQRKLPPPDLAAANSWVGKFVRDAYANQLGYVYAVEDTEDGPVLCARFPEPESERRIHLVEREDGEYIFPGAVRARYRPPSYEDRQRLNKLGQK